MRSLLIAAFAVALTQAGTPDPAAIVKAKSTPAHALDAALPRIAFDAWLRSVVGAEAPTSWAVTDCGEQTGNPALDKDRDFPMCVEADVALAGDRHLFVSLLIGTQKKGVGSGAPAVWSAATLTAGETPHFIASLPLIATAIQQGEQSNISAEAVTLQHDVLAALSGQSQIRPGVKLADRFSPENRQEARTYLAAMFTHLGLEPKRHDYSPTGENIYAVLSSGKPNAETIVLGAHYDSVRGAPGANDDGTGVAAVAAVALEMSRVPARSRDIMFVFFDEEERGLVGSKAFAQMLVDQKVLVHSVHTIDQLGWDSNGNRAVEIELPYERAMELYQAASDRLTPPIPLLATSESGSDHQAFRRLGFKAVGVTEEYRHHDTTPFYHKPGDTFETVNFDYLASSTRLVVEVMKALTK